MRKNNESKYPFLTLGIGGQFSVPIEHKSRISALATYFKKKKGIVFKGETVGAEYVLTRAA